MSSISNQRKASKSSSVLSLNDVSEMMLPPFLNTHGQKPELVEHSFRLQRLSDRSSLYNLKIKWYENEPSKAEFSHDLNINIKDIQKLSRNGSRCSSVPSMPSKPEPEYISIYGADAAEKKNRKIVARAVAQVRRDGHIVRMLFRDEHTPNTTLRDVVNTVIRQLDAEGTRPDVYILSENKHCYHKNTTLRYESLPNCRLSEVMFDPSKELHIAVDFSYELAKRK